MLKYYSINKNINKNNNKYNINHKNVLLNNIIYTPILCFNVYFYMKV